MTGGPQSQILAALAAAACAATGVESREIVFEEWFEDGAMRVDLFHTAGPGGETVGLDEVAREPAWGGSRKNLVDPFGYGEYRFRVHDAATGRLLFSRGFSTLLAEWRTTPEARKITRTMGESIRFPFPRRKVMVLLDAREKGGGLRGIFGVEIDPKSLQVRRDRPRADAAVVLIHGRDDPPGQVDLVILPEGYTRDQAEKMRADSRRFVSILFDNEPWGRWEERVSVRLVEIFSREGGADEPRKGIFRDTLFGASFNTFGMERYLTTTDNKAIREAAGLAPYDLAVVLVNTSRYGGGGIYNFWTIFTSDNEFDDYLFVHELGHAFAGLADEYFSAGGGYDEEEFYPRGVEPWEPNISAFKNGRKENVKWKALIDPRVPIPTPGDEKWRSRVGLFEGGGYKSKGIYRGYYDCKMRSKGLVPFCPVCAGSIERMIRLRAGD